VVRGVEDGPRLRQAIGNPEWADDARFQTSAGRLAHRTELDERLTSWTKLHGDRGVQERLQAAGVPAAAVIALREVFEDSHLKATGFYHEIDHLALGKWRYPSLPLHMSVAPDPPRRPAPMLGEHNGYVFGELLGLSASDIAQLTEEGVLA
jgi:crotonobetainyl-CoA:carnitine CoA-transferase CaiB-like acyl-CoA transferase